MPKIKKNAVDELVDAVKDSAASVEDTPEIKTATTPIDESSEPNAENFVTKDELNVFQENIITAMMDLFKKQTDVHHDLMQQPQAIPGNRLGERIPDIEKVAANDMVEQADLEAFMNQILTIYIHPVNNKEENPVLIPSVNGINQPIFRGREAKVKRKFVEALARNRHTGYEQNIPDVTKPHKYVMVPSMVVKDPFTVRHDPHPHGHEWLQGILAEG